MKYAIYFTWLDGTEDSFNVDTAKYRDENINNLLNRKSFKYIAYCPIYRTNEYGKRRVVYDNPNLMNDLVEQILDVGVTPNQLDDFKQKMLDGADFDRALEEIGFK